MFVALGAHLIQADSIAHQLMHPGQPVYAEIVRHFGPGILNPDGTINRSKLADAAFDSGPVAEKKSSRVKELNRIVHPAVIRRQEEWMDDIGRRDPRAVAIVEAALIIEAGAAKRFDHLIVVTCRDEQRVKRFAARNNLSLEAARQEVTRRMAAQLSDAEKIKAADYVIDNSGSLEGTQAQVRQIWQKLQAQNVKRGP
jgi:dephospho-CoA kinase